MCLRVWWSICWRNPDCMSRILAELLTVLLAESRERRKHFWCPPTWGLTVWGSYCPPGTTVWIMCCFVLLHRKRDGYSVCLSASVLPHMHLSTNWVGLQKISFWYWAERFCETLIWQKKYFIVIMCWHLFLASKILLIMTTSTINRKGQ